MSIAKINIKGSGSLLKRKRLSQALRKGDVDLWFDQETKAKFMEDYLVRGLWGKWRWSGQQRHLKANHEEY